MGSEFDINKYYGDKSDKYIGLRTRPCEEKLRIVEISDIYLNYLKERGINITIPGKENERLQQHIPIAFIGPLFEVFSPDNEPVKFYVPCVVPERGLDFFYEKTENGYQDKGLICREDRFPIVSTGLFSHDNKRYYDFNKSVETGHQSLDNIFAILLPNFMIPAKDCFVDIYGKHNQSIQFDKSYTKDDYLSDIAYVKQVATVLPVLTMLHSIQDTCFDFYNEKEYAIITGQIENGDSLSTKEYNNKVLAYFDVDKNIKKSQSKQDIAGLQIKGVCYSQAIMECIVSARYMKVAVDLEQNRDDYLNLCPGLCVNLEEKLDALQQGLTDNKRKKEMNKIINIEKGLSKQGVDRSAIHEVTTNKKESIILLGDM